MKLILKNNEKIALVRQGVPYNYTLGSSASYALEYNECPLKAYERAVKNGHACYWLNQDARSLTSERRPLPQVQFTITEQELADGVEVYFEGKNFKIYAQPNDNLGLKEISPVPRG